MDRKEGYYSLAGAIYPTQIVSIGEVAKAEKDALLSQFGPHPVSDRKACQLLEGYIMTKKSTIVQYDRVPGYKECVQWLIDEGKRLGLLTPRKQLKGLSGKEIMSVLSRKQLAELGISKRIGAAKRNGHKKSSA